jgi:hypothetical protein
LKKSGVGIKLARIVTINALVVILVVVMDTCVKTEASETGNVSAGGAHTCGFMTNGEASCWGCGSPLNYGETNVPVGLTFTHISADR